MSCRAARTRAHTGATRRVRYGVRIRRSEREGRRWEEEAEESGWKLVHADVFRPPSSSPMLYCISIGSGAQIGVCGFVTIFCSAVGFLSPARRGSLMTATLVFYMLCGCLAGYVSSRLYKSLPGEAVAAVHPPDGDGLPWIVFPHLHLLQYHPGLLPVHRQRALP